MGGKYEYVIKLQSWNRVPEFVHVTSGARVQTVSLSASYYSPTTSTMPQTSLEASSFNYQAIFDNALEGYKKKTGKDLISDPLLCRLESCNSPDAIIAILQAQILRPGQPQSSGDRLLTWLNPTINVLNAFSKTIGVVGSVSLKRSKTMGFTV
jgi:hypothetical protein